MSNSSHGAWDDEEDGVKRLKGYNAHRARRGVTFRETLDRCQRWDEWGVWLWAPLWARFVCLQLKAQNEVLLVDNTGTVLRIIERREGVDAATAPGTKLRVS
jgi:hypothetical protein